MRLIKLVVSILLVLGFALPAMATEWVELSKSDKYTNYIDEASITKKDNGLVLYTSGAKYFEPEKDIINESVLYTDTVSEHAANCLRGTSALLGWQLFYKSTPVQVFNVEQRNISFEVPSHKDSVRNFNFVCDKAGYGSDAFEKARSDTAQAVNDERQATPSQNKASNKSEALEKANIRFAAWTALWTVGLAAIIGFFLTRRYTGTTPKTAHEQGIKWAAWVFFLTVVYKLPIFLRKLNVDSFAILLLNLVILPPIGYAAGFAYFKFRNRNKSFDLAEDNPVQEQVNETAPAPIKTSSENKITSIEKNDEAIDLARYKQAAEEIETGKRDDALWYKAFAEGGGDENATKAAYIRLRVEQLRRAAVAASAVRVTATQPQTVKPQAATQPTKPKPIGAKTLYGVLGIARDANDDQILAAYQKQIASLYAQDNQDAEAKNKLIFLRHAKEVLLDPVKRAAYDARI